MTVTEGVSREPSKGVYGSQYNRVCKGVIKGVSRIGLWNGCCCNGIERDRKAASVFNR